MAVQYATQAQLIAARDSVMKLTIYLQQFAQGSMIAGKAPAEYAAEVDAAVGDVLTKVGAVDAAAAGS